MFPPQVDPTGMLLLSSDAELPLQSIRQILSVQIGEVVFAPTYGCNPGLFESATINESGVKRALDRWIEPDYLVFTTPSYDETQTQTNLVEWAEANYQVAKLPKPV